MSVVVIGLNHRSTPLDLLERVTIGDAALPKALHDLVARADVSEAIVLSTCNRTEVYAVAERFHGAFQDIRDFLAEIVKVPSDNPPGDCAAAAGRAQALLEGLGFKVESHVVPDEVVRSNDMISATNLIVREKFGQGGPTIALNAHGDVVPPGRGWTHDPYGAEIVDDPKHGPVMVGRGVAVSKSDFATYTWAIFALRHLQAHWQPAQPQ